MTRIEQLLRRPAPPAWRAADVLRLKGEIVELSALPDSVVQDLYSDWSEHNFCAGWILVTDLTVDEFAAYLREEV